MPRPELSLSEEAKTALINANAKTGAMPQGTPVRVMEELRNANLVHHVGMTHKGQAARGRLLYDRLESL